MTKTMMVVVCYVFLLLMVITTNATFLRVEDDIKINEKLYQQLYYGNSRRVLGSVDDLQIDLWRNNYTNGSFSIPVTLLENDNTEGINTLSPAAADDIFNIMLRMERKLDNVIKFIRYDGISPKPSHYLRIGNFGGGCWGYVGRLEQSLQPQIINIGSTCIFTDVIEHEIMHALGFFHEHARLDRDEHITVNWNNIIPEKYVNFQKALEINSRGSPYDYQSIMHYSSTAFAINNEIPTITTHNNEEVGTATSMTDIDMEQIRLLYRCESSVRNVLGNCIESCPCRINEGNCTSSLQCHGELSCIGQRCVMNGTETPTVTTTTTASATTAATTVPPTPTAPVLVLPSRTVLYIIAGIISVGFTLVLLLNIII